MNDHRASAGTGRVGSGEGGSPDVVLREMRWWHIGPVLTLERRLFPEDAWTAGMFWSELAHARGSGRTRHYVVAQRPDGELAGYAGLAASPTGAGADVQTLGTAPALQGTGLGTRLLTELLTAATTFGAREVFLEVRVDNERAQRLYTRFGFVPLGVRRGYYQPGNHDALVMRRDHTTPVPAGAPRTRGGSRTRGGNRSDNRQN